MSSKGSVTHWIEQLKVGERNAAAQALWERYFQKLVRFARRKLEGMPRRVADEEDVALSAFKSFCQATKKGRFPDLTDRDDLWRLLLRITADKTVDLIRYNARQKRKALGESVLGTGRDSDARGFAQVVGDDPTPQFAAIMAEEYRRLLDLLEDPVLQNLAELKLEGHTNAEISGRLNCSLRTVERQLHLIRKKWERGVTS